MCVCVCVCVCERERERERRWVSGHNESIHPTTLTFPQRTMSLKDLKDGKQGAERRCVGGGREEGGDREVVV